MSSDFKEKLRSINIGLPARRKPKQTIVQTDEATTHITEHWSDQVDVTVAPQTVQIGRRTADA